MHQKLNFFWSEMRKHGQWLTAAEVPLQIPVGELTSHPRPTGLFEGRGKGNSHNLYL